MLNLFYDLLWKFFFFIDGYVIGYYVNNVRDFLYLVVFFYLGFGREVTFFKMFFFNFIRIIVSVNLNLFFIYGFEGYLIFILI